MKIFLVLFLGAAWITANGQTFTLDWFTIDGGGGTSTGGDYSISGSIGQSEAGPLLGGGQYQVTGGFWSVVAAIQTPGAPLLSIQHVDGKVVVSWPSPSPGFVLQERSDLAAGDWANVTSPLADAGGVRSVTVSSPLGNRFYRLRKP
jgi:hypothetical protein